MGKFLTEESDLALNFILEAEEGILDVVRSRGLGNVYKIHEYLWILYNR